MKRGKDELETVWFPGGRKSFLGSSEEMFRREKSDISSGTREHAEPEQLKRGFEEGRAAAPAGLSAASVASSAGKGSSDWTPASSRPPLRPSPLSSRLDFYRFGFSLWERSIRAGGRLNRSRMAV